MGQGVYSFPEAILTLEECVKCLQKRVPSLHLGGKSALSFHGVRHNLNTKDQWVLWGETRYSLPKWFTSRFSARYVSTQLFDWKDDSLNKKTVGTPPGVLEYLRISVPERALLEMLSEVGKHQSLEEARNLFDGLRNLRQDTLGRLLVCCTSVKTVRLFLTWANETKVIDTAQLENNYPLPVGSDKRWMTRLKDGTLLTLKPHG